MSDAALAAPVVAVPIAPSAPAEAPPVVIEPVAPAPTPTLLSEGGEQPAEVPAASAPEGETAASSPAAEPVVEPQPEQPAPEVAAEPVAEIAPPSYKPFRFADGMGIAPEDENLAKFTEFAGAKGLSQDDAQGLVDLYSAQATKFADELQHSLTQRQFDTFADTVKGWEQEFRADPEFKNRVDTVVNDARWAIRELSGSDAAATELRDVLLASGTGNHRAVIRAFANAARRLKEGQPPPTPVSSTARSGSPADRRYSRMAE